MSERYWRDREIYARMTGISNYEIDNIVNHHYHTKHMNIQCCTPDTLPQVVTYPSFYVCNRSMSWQVGSHWVLLSCISPHAPTEIFDSRALGVHTYSNLLEKFLIGNGNGAYKVNRCEYQPEETYTCGWYALTFLDHRVQGMGYESIVTKFSKTNLAANDRYVASYVLGHMITL